MGKNRLQMQGNPLPMAQFQHDFQRCPLVTGTNRKIIGPIGHILLHGLVNATKNKTACNLCHLHMIKLPIQKNRAEGTLAAVAIILCQPCLDPILVL